MQPAPIRSVLIANRSEIAIRVMRAANEMRIRTVAIYSQQDRQSLHRFKADESYLVGEGKKPLAAYLDGEDILRVARDAGVDAIHPGYGFLSENPDFADAVVAAGLRWIGPRAEVMRTLGNKVAARHAAVAAGVPVMPATPPLPTDLDECRRLAEGIGFPVMLKASWGGGGRGMRAIESADELPGALEASRREALAAFGNDEVYFEKLIRRARHVEVQILGDLHGNIVHLHERDARWRMRATRRAVTRSPLPGFAAVPLLCDRHGPLTCSVDYTAGCIWFLIGRRSQRVFHRGQPAARWLGDERSPAWDIGALQIGASGAPASAERGWRPSHRRVCEDDRRFTRTPQCRVPPETWRSGFLPGYGPARGLPQRGRFRHPARWQHRILRRGDHAVLRLVAGR
ncbi:MAG: biotin carboxylase N-terminal domain-containing protein [Burkholderiaceae bacterium]